MSRPLVRSQDTDDIHDIMRVAQDVSSSPESYCIAKFKLSFSKGPTYNLFLKNKLQFDQNGLSSIISLGSDLDPLSKITGELSGISGYFFDPIIFISTTMVIISFIVFRRKKTMFNIFSGFIGLFGLIFNKNLMYKNYLKDLFRKADGIDHRIIPDEFYNEVLDRTLQLNKYNQMIRKTSFMDVINLLEGSAYNFFGCLRPDLYNIDRDGLLKSVYDENEEILKKYKIL